jgi:hypothetical protein
MNSLSEVTEYKVNIQKSTVFVYTGVKVGEWTEKKISFILMPKNFKNLRPPHWKLQILGEIIKDMRRKLHSWVRRRDTPLDVNFSLKLSYKFNVIPIKNPSKIDKVILKCIQKYKGPIMKVIWKNKWKMEDLYYLI